MKCLCVVSERLRNISQDSRIFSSQVCVLFFRNIAEPPEGEVERAVESGLAGQFVWAKSSQGYWPGKVLLLYLLSFSILFFLFILFCFILYTFCLLIYGFTFWSSLCGQSLARDIGQGGLCLFA